MDIKPEIAPSPRGEDIVMSAWVDSDHAGDLVTCLSRTGFLVIIQSALIYWFSKKQIIVDTLSFGLEFVAMKQCTFMSGAYNINLQQYESNVMITLTFLVTINQCL